jgi:Dual specificity phosphatase, catalytic domain
VKKRVLLPLALLLLPALAAWLVLAGIDHSLREPPNYTLIEPGLYLGGDEARPPRGTSAVLNLCENRDDYQVEFARHEPIRDAAPAPSLDWLREMVGFVETHRGEGRTTFVHCRQGVSRSGMVVTAYLMKKHGWTRDEAIDFIRTRRPQVRPNPAFMELLKEWEKELRE